VIKFKCPWWGECPISKNICLPGSCLSSILGFEPSKTRPKLSLNSNQNRRVPFGFQVYTVHVSTNHWKGGPCGGQLRGQVVTTSYHMPVVDVRNVPKTQLPEKIPATFFSLLSRVAFKSVQNRCSATHLSPAFMSRKRGIIWAVKNLHWFDVGSPGRWGCRDFVSLESAPLWHHFHRKFSYKSPTPPTWKVVARSRPKVGLDFPGWFVAINKSTKTKSAGFNQRI